MRYSVIPWCFLSRKWACGSWAMGSPRIVENVPVSAVMAARPAWQRGGAGLPVEAVALALGTVGTLAPGDNDGGALVDGRNSDDKDADDLRRRMVGRSAVEALENVTFCTWAGSHGACSTSELLGVGVRSIVLAGRQTSDVQHVQGRAGDVEVVKMFCGFRQGSAPLAWWNAEIEALAALRDQPHANIANTLDMFVVAASQTISVGLAMPLATHTLEHMLQRCRGVLAPCLALDFCRQLTAGLIHAHRLGVAHRDLKPSNVYVKGLVSGTPTMQLGDFGGSIGSSGCGGKCGSLAPLTAQRRRFVNERPSFSPWGGGATARSARLTTASSLAVGFAAIYGASARSVGKWQLGECCFPAPALPRCCGR